MTSRCFFVKNFEDSPRATIRGSPTRMGAQEETIVSGPENSVRERDPQSETGDSKTLARAAEIKRESSQQTISPLFLAPFRGSFKITSKTRRAQASMTMAKKYASNSTKAFQKFFADKQELLDDLIAQTKIAYMSAERGSLSAAMHKSNLYNDIRDINQSFRLGAPAIVRSVLKHTKRKTP